MGAAVQLLDAVVAKLDESSFGTITFSRRLLPEITKEDLTPTGVVALQTKESFEQDRANEMVQYTVVVGLNYPTTSTDDLETALDLMEDINDWLALRANSTLTTASGKFKLLHPVLLEQPFDATQAKEANVFFSVLTLKYLFYKSRS
jgi:hypothetical protein